MKEDNKTKISINKKNLQVYKISIKFMNMSNNLIIINWNYCKLIKKIVVKVIYLVNKYKEWKL